MREIKFRVWDKVHNKMVNVIALGFLSNEVVTSNSALTIGKHCELMQYTGLKDKNGKEIYEGDIVRMLYTDWPSKPSSDTRSLDQYLTDIAKIMVVQWDFNGFYVAHKIDGYSEDMQPGKYGYIEVIGNIYETPELLNSSTTPNRSVAPKVQ